METPFITHISSEDFLYVYEPAEDSFLLLDAIESELTYLNELDPTVCVEIGSGSGVIITAVAKALLHTACFAIEINRKACDVTKTTAKFNQAVLEVVNMNLLNGFMERTVDLLIFNPPYVITPDEEIDKSEGSREFNTNIIKSWAGGKDGRVIINKLFDKFDNILSEKGIAYILVIAENKPQEIIANLKNMNFSGKIIAERKIRGEHLFILKINRA